jgi:hypothetical protein
MLRLSVRRANWGGFKQSIPWSQGKTPENPQTLMKKPWQRGLKQ